MDEIKTQAIVLQAVQAKESDLVLFLLSPEHGKLKVYAKGIRKSKKRFFGGIDIFCRASFILNKKNNSEFYALGAIENKHTPISISNSLNHLLILGLIFELTSACYDDFSVEAKVLYPEIEKLRLLAEHNTSMEKLLPVSVYFLLLLSISLGLDATQSKRYFRQDDLLWFTEMKRADGPLQYTPISSAFRAFEGLARYISTQMGIRINSLESLNLLKLN